MRVWTEFIRQRTGSGVDLKKYGKETFECRKNWRLLEQLSDCQILKYDSAPQGSLVDCCNSTKDTSRIFILFAVSWLLISATASVDSFSVWTSSDYGATDGQN